MKGAKIGDTVEIHYTGRLEDGTVFDSSDGRNPLELTLGRSEVIPGFENAIVGMNPSDSRSFKLTPDEAYGHRRDDLVTVVDRKELPEGITPRIDQRLQMKAPDGNAIPLTVTSVSDEKLTLDANHLLAGKTLHFDVRLVKILG